MNPQPKQSEWSDQWSMFRDEEQSLFLDWIYPLTPADFKGKTVLEGGCGGGQHTAMMAPFAESITAIDLNTVEIARERTRSFGNVHLVEADLATTNLDKKFDIVLSIGVIHHTDNPDLTVQNLIRHLKPGGRLCLWVYSREGNGFIAHVVEPLRKRFLCRIPRPHLLALSRGITAAMTIPIYSLYRLPLRFLPYYDYFANFRRLSFARNVLNVFDKLNAPQVQLITRARIDAWLSYADLDCIHVSRYRNVSWRISARLKSTSVRNKNGNPT